VDEYIRPVFASDESVALGVVEPLDLTFVLSSHRLLPSFGSCGESEASYRGCLAPIIAKTTKAVERFIGSARKIFRK
jgi:hypothetical protein